MIVQEKQVLWVAFASYVLVATSASFVASFSSQCASLGSIGLQLLLMFFLWLLVLERVLLGVGWSFWSCYAFICFWSLYDDFGKIWQVAEFSQSQTLELAVAPFNVLCFEQEIIKESVSDTVFIGGSAISLLLALLAKKRGALVFFRRSR